MELTGEEHAILRQCAGLGYGPSPNHLDFIGLYGYAGAHRGQIRDAQAETLEILTNLQSRGLVREAVPGYWETTVRGNVLYRTTFPSGEDQDEQQKAGYRAYCKECKKNKVHASSFLDWSWFNYYKSLDAENPR